MMPPPKLLYMRKKMILALMFAYRHLKEKLGKDIAQIICKLAQEDSRIPPNRWLITQDDVNYEYMFESSVDLDNTGQEEYFMRKRPEGYWIRINWRPVDRAHRDIIPLGMIISRWTKSMKQPFGRLPESYDNQSLPRMERCASCKHFLFRHEQCSSPFCLK